MKNLFKALSFAALVAFSASCTKDLCKDVDAGAHGTCLEGVITCDSGYEPDSVGACNTLMRTKFVGSFRAEERCDTTYNYTVALSANSSSMTKFNIADLYLTGTTMVCDINLTGTAAGASFTIPSQTISTGLTAIGSGTINKATRVITVTYTISDGSSSQSCSADLSPL